MQRLLRSPLGQKRPKLPWLLAAKNTTEQRDNFVPQPVISQIHWSTCQGRAKTFAGIGTVFTRVALDFG